MPFMGAEILLCLRISVSAAPVYSGEIVRLDLLAIRSVFNQVINNGRVGEGCGVAQGF